MEASLSSDKAALRPARWIGTWVAFFVIHTTLMAVDWQLRDHTSQLQPMPGGLPEVSGAIAAWISLILLGVAVFLWMPRSWAAWLRLSLSLVQMGVAYAIVTVSWRYYVLLNSIDTL